MSNRNRMVTPRKGRAWVTSNVQLSLVTGLLSVGSPQISTDFRAKMGREHLKSDTLAHTWVHGFYFQSTAGNASPEFVAFGIGWFPTAMNVANFPPVLTHDGDWQLHDARQLLEGQSATDSMLPREQSSFNLESAGQRSCPGARSYDVFVVAESGSTPSAGTFELKLAVTTLWLIAG